MCVDGLAYQARIKPVDKRDLEDRIEGFGPATLKVGEKLRAQIAMKVHDNKRSDSIFSDAIS